MARTVRLDALRVQVRHRADQSGSKFCSDPELNDYINTAWCELYELLIDSGSEYRLETDTITTASGTSAYDLPSDFFRLRGVDIAISADETLTAHPYMFEERNTYRTAGAWAPGYPVWYRQSGDTVKFIPEPTGVYTVTLHYYPVPTALVSNQNTIDGINGWDDFVVVKAAMKAAAKEENAGLVSQLAAEAAGLATRIRNAAPKRDAGAPERAQDVVGWGGDF